MKIQNARLVASIKANRAGLLLITTLCLVTTVVALLLGNASVPSLLAAANAAEGKVVLSGRLSQNKVVQGDQRVVYLDVSIKSPGLPEPEKTMPATDLIVVMDRSGSMSAAKKMSYAKAAIREIHGNLNYRDRFALVSFADHAIVHAPLMPVSETNRDALSGLIASIAAGGGTNMGEGLSRALSLLANNEQGRSRWILLLSDGQANQGITDIRGLSGIVADMTARGAVLTSIGLGLDFNEVLLARLADTGMGRYAYLEDLSGLSSVLAGDLNTARNVYAHGSTLEFSSDSGVKLLDAGGYPFTDLNASTIGIKTGQLLADSEKRFVLTLSVPASVVGNMDLGRLRLVYRQQGGMFQAVMPEQRLILSVVEPERKAEALVSIDKDVYQYSWIKNNLGRMQQKLSQMLREGKKDQARQVVAEYRSALALAEKESQVPLASPEVDRTLNDLQVNIEESFNGSRPEQEVKRKRAAKSIQYDAIKVQRAQQ